MDTALRVLVLSEDPQVVRFVQSIVSRAGGFLEVRSQGIEAVEVLSKKPIEIAFLDLEPSLFPVSQIVQHIRTSELPTRIVLLGGRQALEAAPDVLRQESYAVFSKPLEEDREVLEVLEKTAEQVARGRRVQFLSDGEVDGWSYEGLIGKSAAIREVYALIERVAVSPSTVLILGESGTGKELVARAVHTKSRRSEKPFVVINCSAIPETLLESELFGHKKGAYTGAIADKKGFFLEADGGTIFLDEIGEIPASMQVKLLRVLQERKVRPLGASESYAIDVRLIAATNKDLVALVKKKEFREDLYYRLNVITIPLVPLRDRKEDVPLLAYHFLKQFAEKAGKTVRKISLDALQALQEYRWPGNVRELENVVERAVVLVEGDSVTARQLPPKLLGDVFYVAEVPSDKDLTHLPYHKAKEKALNLFNRAYITRLLQEAEGNVSRASARAGMDRSNFKKIIRKCELDVREFRKG